MIRQIHPIQILIQILIQIPKIPIRKNLILKIRMAVGTVNSRCMYL